jgi:hypothetical protein
MSEVQNDVRRLLRTALDALAALEEYCTPDAGFMTESIAIENATDEIVDNFDDIVGRCEACRHIIVYGDKGHRCRDDVDLCAECAFTWGEVKDQWDKDEVTPDDGGDRAKFMAAFDSHIASGGTPSDKMLITY